MASYWLMMAAAKVAVACFRLRTSRKLNKHTKAQQASVALTVLSSRIHNSYRRYEQGAGVNGSSYTLGRLER